MKSYIYVINWYNASDSTNFLGFTISSITFTDKVLAEKEALEASLDCSDEVKGKYFIYELFETLEEIQGSRKFGENTVIIV